MPIMTVRRFEYEALKSKLTRTDRIVILSCDGCARQSDGLGGEQGLENLADKLEADGFHVVRREVLPIACSPEQLRDRLNDEAGAETLEQTDVVIPLACRMGIRKAEEILPGLRILRVTETLGKGTLSPDGSARLTEPLDDVGIDVDDAEGMPLPEAAARLGLFPGSF